MKKLLFTLLAGSFLIFTHCNNQKEKPKDTPATEETQTIDDTTTEGNNQETVEEDPNAIAEKILKQTLQEISSVYTGEIDAKYSLWSGGLWNSKIPTQITINYHYTPTDKQLIVFVEDTKENQYFCTLYDPVTIDLDSMKIQKSKQSFGQVYQAERVSYLSFMDNTLLIKVDKKGAIFGDGHPINNLEKRNGTILPFNLLRQRCFTKKNQNNIP